MLLALVVDARRRTTRPIRILESRRQSGISGKEKP